MPSTLICTSITATTVDECLQQMSAAAALSDIIEIRLDFIREPDLPRLLANPPKPVIVTNRPQRERGKFEGDEGERVRLLEQADDLGADYVDVELDSVARLRRRGKAKLIVSYHNFDETPGNLPDIHRQLIDAGADVAKFATFANSITDNAAAFRILQEADFPTIGLCMGERGQISRILAPKYGGFLTFASLATGKESAPGQIDVRTLHELFRFRKIGPETPVYGVIANPVAHSMSPQIHNAAFEQNGINAVYVPLLVDDVAEFLAAFRDLGFQGFSVTIPHKEASLASMDEVEPLSQKIGAINTIRNEGGLLKGSNTDLEAAIGAIEEKLREGGDSRPSPLQDRRVTIVGAGRAGRGIGYGIMDRGGRLLLANRTRSRAEQVGQELGCEALSLEELIEKGFDADVFINASSAGMHPNEDETPVPQDLLKPSMLVFDAVYNPIQTRLLREAEELGCPTVSGFEMFVRQAVGQFELWTGQPAPADVMAEVVRKRLTGAL